MKQQLFYFLLLLGGIATACAGEHNDVNETTEHDSAESELASSETEDNTGVLDDTATAASDTVEAGNSDNGWIEGTDGTVVITDGGELIEDADGTQFVCYPTKCDGRILECGDCRDNDGDGRTDWRDRECLGPCDNTEGPALISDVGGVTGSTCHVDCYFDFGNGMGTGSDDCWWSHECDPLEPEAPTCEYRESMAQNQKFCPSTQSDLCTQVCLPFTPNGCDCFGCCTFPELAGKGENSSDGYVWIGAKDSSNKGTCTFADILDQEKCPRCTPVPNCQNTCEHCEICIGKETLPADCTATDTDSDTDNPPPAVQCEEGVTSCDYDDIMPCSAGYYCISGCCQPVSIEVE